MKILVTGGAGYIGSHMALALSDAGFDTAVADDLSTGSRAAAEMFDFFHGDCGDPKFLDALFAARRFDAVMHFAGSSIVSESASNPGKYMRNNAQATQNLLFAMERAGVRRLVFSSTAAVYGNASEAALSETAPPSPANPYGLSKRLAEQAIERAEKTSGLLAARLRYFNAAGADPACRLGENRACETHLIPLALQAASGRRPCIAVRGLDYPTPDGTCIRDYVHVSDICRAHLLALRRLCDGSGGCCYNLGNGQGFSVLETLKACRKASGRDILQIPEARRPGDPPRLVADASLARSELGWEPLYPDLDQIAAHAWAWEKKLAGL